MKIPVGVLIVTRNEAPRIMRCLDVLKDFDEVVVVDSGSTDDTATFARAAGARVENFLWDGGYPKKRQWCLDHLSLRHDWVFFVDADEIVTPELVKEIRTLFDPPSPRPSPGGRGSYRAGYFVRGAYVRGGRVLKHGLRNNKLALFDRRKIAFPVVDDLDLPGMGEIEGHYQPVLKIPGWIGQLEAPLLHEACDDPAAWLARHERYAAWESGMNRKRAWPRDPVRWRQFLKTVFRTLPGRPLWAFLHGYVLKRGFLDGRAGFDLARDRFRYYGMIGKFKA